MPYPAEMEEITLVLKRRPPRNHEISRDGAGSTATEWTARDVIDPSPTGPSDMDFSIDIAGSRTFWMFGQYPL